MTDDARSTDGTNKSRPTEEMTAAPQPPARAGPPTLGEPIEPPADAAENEPRRPPDKTQIDERAPWDGDETSRGPTTVDEGSADAGSGAPRDTPPPPTADYDGPAPNATATAGGAEPPGNK